MNTIHCNNLGACSLCKFCIEKRHPWYFCILRDDNFGNISDTDECPSFELDEDEGDEVEEECGSPEEIECPECGSDAYWQGDHYACDQCGWCGDCEDDDEYDDGDDDDDDDYDY